MADFDLTKELTTYLDLPEGIDSAEKLREAVDDKFISRDQATKDPKIIGAITGGYETRIKKIAKSSGIEFDDGELDGKKLPEVFELSINKQKSAFETQLDEVKATPNDQVQKWEDKFNKQKESLNQFKERATTLASEVEQMKADKDNFIKNEKIKAHKDSAFQGINWSNQIDDFAKKGFKATIDETYKPEFDEDGNIFPTKEGKRIPNEKKKDTFLNYSELIKFEAEKANLTAKNGGVPRQRVPGFKPNASGIVDTERIRKKAARVL